MENSNNLIKYQLADDLLPSPKLWNRKWLQTCNNKQITKASAGIEIWRLRGCVPQISRLIITCLCGC